jgi:hypothetical protein
MTNAIRLSIIGKDRILRVLPLRRRLIMIRDAVKGHLQVLLAANKKLEKAS